MRPSKLFLLLAFVVGPFATYAYTSPGTPTGYVNDYAKLFTEDESASLEGKLSEFERASSNEISVVTIKSLEGDTVENIALQLFQEWGIGKADSDNGVLLLIAKDDRKMRIEVGYGLEGGLTDLTSSKIISFILTPAFQRGDFYDGVNLAVDAMIAATRGEYAGAPSEASLRAQFADMVGGFMFAVYLFGFIFMFLASILARSKSWHAGGIVGGIVGLVFGWIVGIWLVAIIGFVVLTPLGLLLDYIVSTAYRRAKGIGRTPSWWIGGSGFGGGGGGGGGGFGGFGGGSSGGGGASGGW